MPNDKMTYIYIKKKEKKRKKLKKKQTKKQEPFFVDILHKFQRESIKNNQRAIRSTWGLNYWFCLQMSKKITTDETKMSSCLG